MTSFLEDSNISQLESNIFDLVLSHKLTLTVVSTNTYSSGVRNTTPLKR